MLNSKLKPKMTGGELSATQQRIIQPVIAGFKGRGSKYYIKSFKNYAVRGKDI